MSITILEKTRDYIVVRIPRKVLGGFRILEKNTLSASEALKILRSGMGEYRQGKTRVLTSLRNLR